jgi:hypothetical protein
MRRCSQRQSAISSWAICLRSISIVVSGRSERTSLACLGDRQAQLGAAGLRSANSACSRGDGLVPVTHEMPASVDEQPEYDREVLGFYATQPTVTSSCNGDQAGVELVSLAARMARKPARSCR